MIGRLHIAWDSAGTLTLPITAVDAPLATAVLAYDYLLAYYCDAH